VTRPLRILFAFAGGGGHLEPLVPLAAATRDAGHAVAFAARPWMVPKVESLGFEAIPAGTDRGLAPVTRPLLEVDRGRELLDLRDGFGRRIARERAADLLPIVARWRPDLVVWEETDFGAAVVAERLGLPHATVLVTAAGSFVTPALMAPALDDVRAEHHLPRDPTAKMLHRHLVLSPFPPSFRDPEHPLPAASRVVRLWDVSTIRPDRRPAWATVLPHARSAYVTLGTVFNHESGDLFERVLGGVGRLPLNVLVTVGREIDPERFGPQPPNVTIERFVPQADVLPHADIVVSHAGSGSVLGALAHGRPIVLLPMGADQPWNADRCAALGVGRVLDVIRATPDDIASAIEAVLAGPAYRQAAERLAAEVAALPAPAEAVPLLARLAGRGRGPTHPPTTR
jgi:UDP:flavonoid glycosyltransferase YjiC (YdhE family)